VKVKVKVKNFSQNKKKFGYINVMNPVYIVERALLEGRFLKQKIAEYHALKAEIGTPDSTSTIHIDPVTSTK
jgi:hypothetical protein